MNFLLHTYNCHSSTSLPLLYGCSCVIDCRHSHFSNFWLCSFVWLCHVRFCQQVFAHSAGLMFWWMAKNMITNNTNNNRAAGLLYSAVYIELPRRHRLVLYPTMELFVHTFVDAHEVSNMVYYGRSLKSWIKTPAVLDDIWTSSNVVYENLQSNIAVEILKHGNSTSKTVKINVTVQ